MSSHAAQEDEYVRLVSHPSTYQRANASSVMRSLGIAYAGNEMRVLVARRLANGRIRTYASGRFDPLMEPALAVAVIVVSVSDLVFRSGWLTLLWRC
jgi:hypothetical protein